MGGAFSSGNVQKREEVSAPVAALRWIADHQVSGFEGAPEFTGFVLPGGKKGEPQPWEIGHLSWGEEAPDNGRFSYDGQFKHGKEHGYGIGEWHDGTAFHGAWREGKPHGLGASLLDGHVSFRGFFEGGERHGRGVELRLLEEDDAGFIPTLEATWERGKLRGGAIVGRTRKSLPGLAHVIRRDAVVTYKAGGSGDGDEAGRREAFDSGREQHTRLARSLDEEQVAACVAERHAASALDAARSIMQRMEEYIVGTAEEEAEEREVDEIWAHARAAWAEVAEEALELDDAEAREEVAEDLAEARRDETTADVTRQALRREEAEAARLAAVLARERAEAEAAERFAADKRAEADVAQQAANTKLVAAKEMRTKADKMREDAEQEAGKCLELRRRRAALAGELAGARAALDEARLAAAGAEAAETEGRAVEQQEEAALGRAQEALVTLRAEMEEAVEQLAGAEAALMPGAREGECVARMRGYEAELKQLVGPMPLLLSLCPCPCHTDAGDSLSLSLSLSLSHTHTLPPSLSLSLSLSPSLSLSLPPSLSLSHSLSLSLSLSLTN